MLNIFKNSPKIVIGIDIGVDFIKLVKASRQAGKIYVDDFIFHKFQSETTLSEKSLNQLTDILSSVASQREIKKAKFYISISSSKFCIRVVDLPFIPQNEIYQAVRARVRKYVSPELEKIIFSYNVLGQIQDKGTKKLEAVFVAAQRNFLESYINIFDGMGVNTQTITASSFGLSNLIRESKLYSQTDSLMLLNIENRETDITVYQKGKFVFTRNIPLGVKNFTDILQQESHKLLQTIDEVNAAWKIGEEKVDRETSGQKSSTNTKDLLQSEARMLSKEIELTTNHYYQVSHGKKIDKCIILGEGSQIVGLLDFLMRNSSIAFDSLNVEQNILEVAKEKNYDLKKNIALYATALGVLWSRPDDINLVSELGPQRKKKILIFSKVNLIGLGFIGLALVLVILLKGIGLYYENRISHYKTQQDNLRQREAKLVEIRKKTDTLEFKRNLYSQLKKSSTDYPFIVNLIFNAIPSEKLVLTGISFVGQEARGESDEVLSGVAFTIEGNTFDTVRSRSDITQFVLALEDSGIFENISVSTSAEVLSSESAIPEKGSEQEPTKGLSFSIKGNIKIDN